MTEYKPGQRLTLTHEAWPAPLIWTVYRDGRYIEHPGLGGMFLHQLEEGVSITHVDGYPIAEIPTLPTLIGAAIQWPPYGDLRTVALRTGSDGWQVTGRPGYASNHEILSMVGYQGFLPLVTLDEARPIIAREIEQFFRETPNPLASRIVRAIAWGPEVSE